MGKFAAMEGQAGFGVGLTTVFQFLPPPPRRTRLARCRTHQNGQHQKWTEIQIPGVTSAESTGMEPFHLAVGLARHAPFCKTPAVGFCGPGSLMIPPGHTHHTHAHRIRQRVDPSTTSDDCWSDRFHRLDKHSNFTRSPSLAGGRAGWTTTPGNRGGEGHTWTGAVDKLPSEHVVPRWPFAVPAPSGLSMS